METYMVDIFYGGWGGLVVGDGGVMMWGGVVGSRGVMVVL